MPTACTPSTFGKRKNLRQLHNQGARVRSPSKTLLTPTLPIWKGGRRYKTARQGLRLTYCRRLGTKTRPSSRRKRYVGGIARLHERQPAYALDAGCRRTTARPRATRRCVGVKYRLTAASLY